MPSCSKSATLVNLLINQSSPAAAASPSRNISAWHRDVLHLGIAWGLHVPLHLGTTPLQRAVGQAQDNRAHRGVMFLWQNAIVNFRKWLKDGTPSAENHGTPSPWLD